MDPVTKDAIIFHTAITSALCQYWLHIGLFYYDDQPKPEFPTFILASTIQLSQQKFYFDIDASNEQFSNTETLLHSLEATLLRLSEIETITIQGNRIIVTGDSSIVFSITLFEVSEQFDDVLDRPTKTFMLHSSVNVW